MPATAQTYITFLHKEGYQPEADQHGNVVFKHQGGTYLIIVQDKDEEFFTIVFPNFWKIESEDERVKVGHAANVATEHTKVAKVYPVGDNTWATIELFLGNPTDYERVFARCLSAINTAVQKFASEMRGGQ